MVPISKTISIYIYIYQGYFSNSEEMQAPIFTQHHHHESFVPTLVVKKQVHMPKNSENALYVMKIEETIAIF